MPYNKAKAQKDWELWKKAEEEKMRSLGVDETTIQKLREYDWNAFNSERCGKPLQPDRHSGGNYQQKKETNADSCAADKPGTGTLCKLSYYARTGSDNRPHKADAVYRKP